MTVVLKHWDIDEFYQLWYNQELANYKGMIKSYSLSIYINKGLFPI